MATAQDITAYVSAEMSDSSLNDAQRAAAIREKAAQYGVTYAQIAQATGYPVGTVIDYLETQGPFNISGPNPSYSGSPFGKRVMRDPNEVVRNDGSYSTPGVISPPYGSNEPAQYVSVTPAQAAQVTQQTGTATVVDNGNGSSTAYLPGGGTHTVTDPNSAALLHNTYSVDPLPSPIRLTQTTSPVTTQPVLAVLPGVITPGMPAPHLNVATSASFGTPATPAPAGSWVKPLLALASLFTLLR